METVAQNNFQTLVKGLELLKQKKTFNILEFFKN